MHTLTTDGFHVTSRAAEVGEQVEGGNLVLEAGLGVDLRLVLGDVGEHAVDRDAVASVRICSSPGTPTMRVAGDAAAGDGGGVAAVLHAERLAGLGRAGERVEAGRSSSRRASP